MKSVSIGQLFNLKKRSYHVIDENCDYSSQSLASYILLKRQYVSMQPSYDGKLPYKVRIWLTFRNKILRKMKKEKGSLSCFFCGKENLTANFNNPKANLYGGKATLDHYVPKSKGGKEFSESNLVCSCNKCNQAKKDLSAEEFLKRQAS